MMSKKEIQAQIQVALPDAEVQILDPMDDGVHLAAIVVSASFEGKAKVMRHRMVYKALGDAFDGPIHALQMTTVTPEENKTRLDKE